MSWKCPQCNKELDSLDYRVNTSGTDYGTAFLTDNKNAERSDRITEYECDDNERGDWSNDPEYTCPHCNRELIPSELIWEDLETKIEQTTKKEEQKPKIPEEPEETLHNIIKPEIILDEEKAWKKSQTETLMICKKCHYTFPYFQNKESFGNDTFECPKCRTTTSLNEYQQLLHKGIFEKRRKMITIKVEKINKTITCKKKQKIKAWRELN